MKNYRHADGQHRVFVAMAAPPMCEPIEKKVNPRVTTIFSMEAAEWLNAQAMRRSCSTSEIVRRIVDEVRGSYIVPRPQGR